VPVRPVLVHQAVQPCDQEKDYLCVGGAIGSPHRKPIGRKLEQRKKLHNRHHTKIRALGKHGAAILKSWHILRKARCSPSRLTSIVQAIPHPAPPGGMKMEKTP
jgi:hypothetical protein